MNNTKKQYYTIGTVPISNRKNMEGGKIDTVTYQYMAALFVV